MGSANSRLNTPEEDHRTRPTLVDRFEELRKRRKEGNLSAKQLLKNDVVEEDDNSQSSLQTISDEKLSFPMEIQPPKEEMDARTMIVEKLSRVVPMPIVEQVNKDMDPNQDMVFHAVEPEKKHENEPVDVKEPKRENEQVVVEEPKRENEQKVGVEELKRESEQEVDARDDNDDNKRDDDDDGDESEEVNRFLCPGSPSFRIYCVEAEKEEVEESKKPTTGRHRKSHSVDSVESTGSRNSNEVLQVPEIESTTKRRGNKKKFGAMKTLLKVKSCYYPMCSCTGGDKGNIITAKSPK